MPKRRTSPLTHWQADAGTDAASWISGHRAEIRQQVRAHGAVLVRGLRTGDRAATIAAVRAVIGEAMPEREAFAPRDAYGDGVYSASYWSDDQPMCAHNELSYVAIAPHLLAFGCVTPPATGGVTGLADVRAVMDDLPADLVARFIEHGWRLDRRYLPLVGTRWQDAFGTGDPAAVERYCAGNGVQVSWQEDGTLHTSQTRAAVVAHPDTGETCWFNQIAFLNEWSIEPEAREYLVGEFGRENLPFNTRYGDGAPLDRGTVEHMRAVYRRHTVGELWQHGDLLVVDNVLMAHSREPYTGQREIVVGFGEPFRPVDHPAGAAAGQSKLSVW
jgi:alpha-ketoglutarate-dependent taurine dioxygenase